jgi:NADH-quinone oxidoreductase subunit N
VYGATGSTQFSAIGATQSTAPGMSVVLLLGIAMLVVGFGFKIAAVPFHMWTPDVYEGAPTPYTAFMAAGVKTAAFASLIRLWIEAFPAFREHWIPVIWWLAAATMIFGNLVALQQKNVKRMLAYSSIAHAGYLLVALASGSVAATSTLVFYMMAYTLATMGAFAVVVAVSRPGEQGQRVSDLEGLWQSKPWLASAMAVFMMSLLGFPIAGGMGFWAKWYVLKTALTGPVPQNVLAVVLVLTSVISAGYYLGIVLTMYMKPLAPDAPRVAPTPRLTGWVIGISAAALLFFGVLPGLLVKQAGQSMPAVTHLQAAPAVPSTAAKP